MSPINACFISYRRTGDPEAHKFILSFVKQLKKQLACYLPNAPIYFDQDGSKIGDQYPAEIAYQLCRSACMVLFFSPCHFDSYHPYCALEYHAMLRLEQQRLQGAHQDLRNQGLIFPIEFRGTLPEEITASRHYERFPAVVETDFARRAYQDKFNTLSERIAQRYQALLKAGVFAADDCQQFRFPEKETIMPWIHTVAFLPPMPGR